MMAPRILVIEDDDAIRRGVVDVLQFEGYRTLEASCGTTGLEMALSSQYDLMLLDLVLPGHDGLDILEKVHAEMPTLPVIIMTARGDEADRIRGLRLGADDYVVKPFSVKELSARIEAVLRRSPERPLDVVELTLPQGTANLQQQIVQFDDGQCVQISERETAILAYLSGHAGRPISRDELLSRVWRINPRGVQSRTIDMHIARLREKLRDDPNDPSIIQTIRGKGYMYAAGEAVP
jgi:DNA-binding response OmpR family regulator